MSVITAQSFKVKVLFDFNAEDEDEINLVKGEIITVLQKDEGFDDQWFTGMKSSGEVGLFPSAYVSTLQISSSDKDIEQKEIAEVQAQKNPEDWSVAEVSQWLATKGFGRRFVEQFKVHKIDGVALMSMRVDLTTLKELGVGTLDRRMRLLNQISSLRRAHRNNSEASSVRPLSSNMLSIPPSPQKEDFPVLLSPDSASGMSLIDTIKQRRKNVLRNTAKVRSDVKTLSDVLLIPTHTLNLNIEYSGYLWKRGGAANWSWKKRYFVLKTMTLWYFKSDNGDSQPLGLIPLPSYSVAPSSDCDIQRRNYTFEARHPDARTYYFKAESCSEMNQWMNAMTRSALGMDLPRMSNEYGLPRLRALKPLTDELDSSFTCHLNGQSVSTQTTYIDTYTASVSEVNLFQVCNVDISPRPAPKYCNQSSTQSSIEEDKARILNKIKRMGINPLEAISSQVARLEKQTEELKIQPTQPSRVPVLSFSQCVEWINNFMELNLVELIDELKNGIVVTNLTCVVLAHELPLKFIGQSRSKLNLDATYRLEYIENYSIVIELLRAANVNVEGIQIHKIVDGDQQQIISLVSLLKQLSIER